MIFKSSSTEKIDIQELGLNLGYNLVSELCRIWHTPLSFL